MSALKLPPATMTQVTGAASVPPSNLNPRSEDCYYYYYSSCAKGDKCQFRHSSAALGSEEVCKLWVSGGCTRPVCAFRHTVLNHQRSATNCYWETQPSGCLKSHCPFKHNKPRPQMPGAITRVNEFKDTVNFASVNVKTLEEIRKAKTPLPPSTLSPTTPSATITPMSFSLQTALNSSRMGTTHTKGHSLPQIQPKAMTSAVHPRTSIFSRNKYSYSIFNPSYQPPVNPRPVKEEAPSVPGRKLSGQLDNGVGGVNSAKKSTPSEQVPPVAKTSPTAGLVTKEKGKDMVATSNKSTPSEQASRVSSIPKRAVREEMSDAVDSSIKSPPPQHVTKWTFMPGRTVKERLGNAVGSSNKSTPSQQALCVTIGKDMPTRIVRERVSDIVPAKPAPENKKDKPKGSSKSLSLSTPSSGGGRGILYGERKVGEMGFQVKTLAEIRAERKRRFEQRDTVESLRTPLPDVLPLSNRPSSSGEATPRSGEDLKPPATKKKKIVIIRRKSSASRESQVSAQGKPTPRAPSSALTVGSHISERKDVVKTIVARRVKAPSSSLAVDRTCTDRSDEMVGVEGGDNATRTNHSQPMAQTGEPASQPSNVDEGEAEGVAVPMEFVYEESVMPQEEQERGGVQGKSVAEVKAEIQRELDHREPEIGGDETLDAELQQLAELEEGEGDHLLDSRTDDDLILEMEEFI